MFLSNLSFQYSSEPSPNDPYSCSLILITSWNVITIQLHGHFPPRILNSTLAFLLFPVNFLFGNQSTAFFKYFLISRSTTSFNWLWLKNLMDSSHGTTKSGDSINLLYDSKRLTDASYRDSLLSKEIEWRPSWAQATTTFSAIELQEITREPPTQYHEHSTKGTPSFSFFCLKVNEEQRRKQWCLRIWCMLMMMNLFMNLLI